MLWQRSEQLHPSPPKRSPTVPGSDAVRQAALQASWKRDRRVASRRLAWRWVVWCLQRYSLPVVAGLGVLSIAAFFAGAWPEWPSHSAAPESTTRARAPSPYVAPSVPTVQVAQASSREAAVTEEAFELPTLSLRASTSLGERTAASAPQPAPTASADTLSLKPETWLHSKEP